MYHYTYLIKDKHSEMKYIGVRSCNCLPKDDIMYWGSSRHLPKDVSSTHKKRVLSIFATRKEAVAHEIALHNKYDVAVNIKFYNKAKQTSTGFDTAGITIPEEVKLRISKTTKGVKKPPTHGPNVSKSTKGKPKSEQHRKNCSIAQKLIASSPDYVNPNKGITLSDHTKSLISKTKKDKKESVGVSNPRFSPWFIVVFGNRYEFTNTTKGEFAVLNNLNPDSFRSQASRSSGVKKVGCVHLGKCLIGNI